MPSIGYTLFLAALPAAILLGAKRMAAGTRVALLVTIALTWTAATLAYAWFCPDPSDLSAVIRFFLIILPALAIPTAAFVATRIVHRPGETIAAMLLGMLGWIVGIVVLFVAPFGSADLAARAFLVAPPAILIASGAVLAAGLDRTER